ncbi:MAG: iron-containing alcohol dehydrogenase [Rhodocyclaceae bacterium]|nr:iron-containing alcohol dehydrogenase [Rhodocyclaceae bacterium]
MDTPFIPPFSIARLPRIEFGCGSLIRLPDIAGSYGKRLLLITGRKSFTESEAGRALLSRLQGGGFSWEVLPVSGEPSPRFVDEAVASLKDGGFDAVLGIGGGSALDAAKAIAGLLKPGNSVMDHHLEGVGPELPYRGPATPFIAVPTTAGTGSEATKNAVLSVQGPDGFKKSFRDDKLMAEWAVVDPDLLATCPPELIAADGMDAFTQLLESFVSTRANPMTDALARSGIMAVKDGLLAWHEGGEPANEGRERMAYASLLSGICLAQTGLGSVHGLAAPLGAFFPIPHGVACGTLVATATRINIEALTERQGGSPALPKYAEIGRRFAMQKGLNGQDARQYLLDELTRWQEVLCLPGLSAYGVTAADIPRIVANARGSSMKTNPVVLTDEEIGRIVAERM